MSKKDTTAVISPLPDTTNNAAVNALIGMNAPASFNYETLKDVSLDITILAPDNTPFPNIPVSIMSKSVELGGVALYKSFTNSKGNISGKVKLATHMTQLVIDTKYLRVI